MYRSDRRERRRLLPRFLLFLVLVGGPPLALGWTRIGPVPTVTVEPGLRAIGPRTPITVLVEEPSRGLSGVRVDLVQDGREVPLAEVAHEPRPYWAFWGPKTDGERLDLEVGKELQGDLSPGEATIRVTCERAGTWLRRPEPSVTELTLPVELTPPTLEHIAGTLAGQGSSAVAVYWVGPNAHRDGVRIGDREFPGYPLPGGETGDRFALFGVPHDLEDGRSSVLLWASDVLGNEVSQPFLRRFDLKARPNDTVRLSDEFLERKATEILPRAPDIRAGDDPLSTYLTLNRDLRRRNGETLDALAAETRPEFLWRQAFLQLPGSRVMATFGDRRTYLYDGQEVDQQFHLGYDLASIRRAEVPSAAGGVVVLADYLGIYGNTVVVDHGYGLMSLYSHLSALSVTAGQGVTRGETVGRTGTTGLAGGDHLHYSVLIHGQMVDPLEWWDQRWIETRILELLGDAFGS
ncbi:MAG: M23 family metallopeptidase [Acidobacteriota bacterium]